MRPIYLEISAFGPYAGKMTLEMDKLGENGLYLITGDTGAGKTTIFDAVSYALFGKPSGEHREENMLRSNYAEPDVPTYVELRFEYQGKIYTVRRNPEYPRPAKRGDKMTTQPANAELTLPDGKVITQKNAVSKKIEEILGINDKQFAQIAMIAQGDFLKLLLASTEERREIFSRIFKTGDFSKLQERLKRESSKLQAESDNLNNSIKQFVDTISLDEDDPMRVRWDAVQERKDIVAAIELIDEIIKNDIERKAQLEQKLSEFDAEITELIRKADFAKQIQKQKSDYEKLQNLIQSLNGELAELENRKNEADGKLPQAEELDAKVVILKNQLSEYEELEQKLSEYSEKEQKLTVLKRQQTKTEQEHAAKSEKLKKLREEFELLQNAGEQLIHLRNELDKLKKHQQELDELRKKWNTYCEKNTQLEAAQKDCKAAETNHQRAETECSDLRNEFDSLSGIEAELVALKHKKESADTKLSELRTLSNAWLQYEESCIELKNAQNHYSSKKTEADLAKNRYDRLFTLYLDGQAGVLAQRLEEGNPCPVCGSIEHPNPAQLALEVPTEEELDKAKNTSDSAAELARNASEDAKTLIALTEEKRKGLQAGADRLLDGCAFTLIGQNTDEAITKTLEESAILSKNIEEADRKNERKTELEKLIVEKRKSADELAQKLQKHNEKLAGLTSALSENEQELVNAASKVFSDVSMDMLESALQIEANAVSGQIRETETKISNEQNRLIRRDELNSKIPALETECGQLQEALTETEKNIAAQSAELERRSDELQERRTKLAYPGKNEAESAIFEMEQKRDKLRKTAEDAHKAVEDKKIEISAADGELRKVAKELENAPIIELAEIESELTDRNADKTACSRRKEQVAGNIVNNERNLKAIHSKREELINVDKKFRMVKNLSDTANGTLSGSEKIMLETYVQMTYFERIISRANKRFNAMSNGQYDLERRGHARTKSGKTGLDLDVIDHYNGTRRAVNTLSGGESFMASLSLALGLSDEVQESAGGIKLDTMFVDEGFGSLDEETLRLALRALENLTDGGQRLVGIISHVAELQREIHPQIVVRKEASGGSKAEIKL